MMPVFVTDGEQRSALAVTRALGRAGIPVTVGESSQPSLAGSSRYCQRHLCYPSPLENPEQFTDFLSYEMRKGNYRLVIPMTDVTMQLVARIGKAIAPVRAPVPTGEQVLLAQDKKATLMLAQSLGIACPATYMMCEHDRIEEVATRVQYPVVIKPRWSCYQRGARWVQGPVQYAQDANELTRKYCEIDSQLPQPMVQETIEGEGRGVFLLLWNGGLKAAFCHRRLREKPPSGGVSVLRESIRLDDDLVAQSLDLLNAIGWQGVAMVEFKLDERDGRPKLMEINGRFWGSLQLAIDAGVNFPLMLYRLANGEDVAPQFDYREGVKTRWLLGDLDHLLIRLKQWPAQNGSCAQDGSRLRACGEFLKFYQRDMHYEVFKLDDPRPGWLEWKDWVRALLTRKERAGAG